MRRPSKLPRDINQRAKYILDAFTGDAPTEAPLPEKNQAAVALGRLGGLKGGKARKDALTPERRKEIARDAVNARWAKRQ